MYCTAGMTSRQQTPAAPLRRQPRASRRSLLQRRRVLIQQPRRRGRRLMVSMLRRAARAQRRRRLLPVPPMQTMQASHRRRQRCRRQRPCLRPMRALPQHRGQRTLRSRHPWSMCPATTRRRTWSASCATCRSVQGPGHAMGQLQLVTSGTTTRCRAATGRATPLR